MIATPPPNTLFTQIQEALQRKGHDEEDLAMAQELLLKIFAQLPQCDEEGVGVIAQRLGREIIGDHEEALLNDLKNLKKNYV